MARDQDWNFAFLIAWEKKKLQRMHDYFKYQGHPEVNRMAPRDIAICIRLIDIFMEDDAAYIFSFCQKFINPFDSLFVAVIL